MNTNQKYFMERFPLFFRSLISNKSHGIQFFTLRNSFLPFANFYFFTIDAFSSFDKTI